MWYSKGSLNQEDMTVTYSPGTIVHLPQENSDLLLTFKNEFDEAQQVYIKPRNII